MALDDTLVGVICHIKGRKPKSARYDPAQTPAERNDYANLVIMCGVHHTVIDDDEEAYTVERLYKIKAEHEAHATPIDDATAANVASSYTAVSSEGQIGGITAHQINARDISVTNAQVIDPVLQRRQLHARENLWNVISTLRSQFSLVLYVDNVFLANELDEFFTDGKRADALNVIAEYRHRGIAADKMSSVDPDKDRPFIPHNLWSIVYTIRAFYGRAAILLHWSFEKRSYQDWRADNGMDQILRSLIPAHLVDEVKKRTFGGLTVAVDYLQNKFLADAGLQG
jgi:hypothetical protein